MAANKQASDPRERKRESERRVRQQTEWERENCEERKHSRISYCLAANESLLVVTVSVDKGTNELTCPPPWMNQHWARWCFKWNKCKLVLSTAISCNTTNRLSLTWRLLTAFNFHVTFIVSFSYILASSLLDCLKQVCMAFCRFIRWQSLFTVSIDLMKFKSFSLQLCLRYLSFCRNL